MLTRVMGEVMPGEGQEREPEMCREDCRLDTPGPALV